MAAQMSLVCWLVALLQVCSCLIGSHHALLVHTLLLSFLHMHMHMHAVAAIVALLLTLQPY